MYGKAIKKPVEIDWFKWDGKNDFELDMWVQGFGQRYMDNFISTTNSETGNLNLYVKTLEGTSYEIPIGYIIIRGIEGEYYPCEPQIFEKTYNISG